MLDGGGAFIYEAAHWAAPAHRAGLFESCEKVALGQTMTSRIDFRVLGEN